MSARRVLPACLLPENFNGLVTLWSVVKPFQAHLFSHLAFVLGQMHQLTKTADRDNGPSPGSLQAMGSASQEALESCSYLGMRLSILQLQEAEELTTKALADAILNCSGQGWSYANRSIFDAAKRLGDELKQAKLFAVPPDKQAYFAPMLFGNQVETRFVSASRDIGEAGRCLAFDLGTACVFHLMRVMETGLRALARSLKDPDLDPRRNPSWDAMLKKCDGELRLPLKDRSAEWKMDDVFYSAATANLRSVKNAWRNTTMHVEIDYNPDTAADIFNAVKGFMRHLCTKLHDEDGRDQL
jgi:hypothetical protein